MVLEHSVLGVDHYYAEAFSVTKCLYCPNAKDASMCDAVQAKMGMEGECVETLNIFPAPNPC